MHAIGLPALLADSSSRCACRASVGSLGLNRLTGGVARAWPRLPALLAISKSKRAFAAAPKKAVGEAGSNANPKSLKP